MALRKAATIAALLLLGASLAGCVYEPYPTYAAAPPPPPPPGYYYAPAPTYYSPGYATFGFTYYGGDARHHYRHY